MIAINHPDKIYYPKLNITKSSVFEYYQKISPYLLKYLKDKPITIRSFPEGLKEQGIWLRNIPTKHPDYMESIPYKTKSEAKTSRLILVNSKESLLWWVNRGAIEFHPWQSKKNNLKRPVMAIFDIDIASSGSFDLVLKTALLIKEILDQQHLTSFVKTSGQNGMHVMVPIKPQYTFNQVKTWVKNIAEYLASGYPDVISMPTNNQTHQNLATIDYAQNSVGKNTISAYSLRGSENATISTPLTWSELEKGSFSNKSFSIDNIQCRLEKLSDILEPMYSMSQLLTIQ